jgi:hypothetical protein
MRMERCRRGFTKLFFVALSLRRIASGWVLSFRFFLSVPNDQDQNGTSRLLPIVPEAAKVIEQQTINLRPLFTADSRPYPRRKVILY